jgi:hypothetical protein
MEEILGLAEFAEHRGALDARLERGRRELGHVGMRCLDEVPGDEEAGNKRQRMMMVQEGIRGTRPHNTHQKVWSWGERRMQRKYLKGNPKNYSTSRSPAQINPIVRRGGRPVKCWSNRPHGTFGPSRFAAEGHASLGWEKTQPSMCPALHAHPAWFC